MNRSFNKFWVRASSRRFISLFITVIWLATALQPCVMASVVDSEPSNIETHHPSNMPGIQDENDHPGCPHCKTVTDGNEHCDSQVDKVCDDDESLVYDSRIKPLDNEKFDNQAQPAVFFASRELEFNPQRSTVASISKSLNLPAGPPLIDLYRVYLK